jgi:two-component system, OmpR family, response regulator BaeR
MNTILIVEDEVNIALLEADYLKNAGFTVHFLANGLNVINWLDTNNTDLILLDLTLPDCDGLELCKQIRKSSSVPIIMVTARIEEIDRLLGLEMGADDYICKPFSFRELVARVKTVLRRQRLSVNPEEEHPLLIQLNSSSLRASAGGRELELTLVEFKLLQALILRPGHICSRNVLMDLIYQDHRVVSERTIDSHIKKLRKKLYEILPTHEVIHSVYGVGYRYEQIRLS